MRLRSAKEALRDKDGKSRFWGVKEKSGGMTKA